MKRGEYKTKIAVWENIQLQYESGISVLKIQEVLNGEINRSSVYSRAKKEGWDKDKNKDQSLALKHIKKSQERRLKALPASDNKIREALKNDKYSLINSLADELEKDYDNSIRGIRYIQKLTLEKLKKLEDDEGDIDYDDIDFQELSTALGIIKQAKELLVGNSFDRGALFNALKNNITELDEKETIDLVKEKVTIDALNGDKNAVDRILPKTNAKADAGDVVANAIHLLIDKLPN